jgi:hypothetical protein
MADRRQRSTPSKDVVYKRSGNRDVEAFDFSQRVRHDPTPALSEVQSVRMGAKAEQRATGLGSAS